MPGSAHVAIVGGGIGGLTAALALRARGLDVTVFEQAEVLREMFVAAFFFLLPCLGIYLLDSAISPVVGIISLGLASGTEIDMIGFLTSRYFGMKRFGQLYGYLFASFVVGSAIGPYMMGLAFERLHSYEPALWMFSAFMLLASGAILSLGPYRFPADEKTPVGAGRGVDAPATEHRLRRSL